MAGLASLATGAFAADMPVKAIPLPPVNWAGLSGFYAGVDFSGGLNRDQLVAGLAATTFRTAVTGAGGGLRAGYAWNRSASSFIMVEAGITRQSFGADSTCAPPMVCSVSSKWSGDFGVDYGFSSAAFVNLLPDLGLGGLFPAGTVAPAGTTNAGWHPLIGVFGHAEQVDAVVGGMAASKWVFQPGVRLSMLTKVTNNVVLKTSVEATFATDHIAFNPTTFLNNGTTIKGRMSLLTGAAGLGSLIGLNL